MTVFIELTTDAFDDLFNERFSNFGSGGGASRTSRAGKSAVRRPHRGIEIKEDTYAMLKVIRADGSPVPLFDQSSASGQTTDGYASFLLQSAGESRMEKHQLVETFGDSYIYFFGESPRFIDFQSILLNSHDFNWEAEWWQNYDTYFRGTRLVEQGARAYMFFDDSIIEGYIVQSQANKTAATPYQIPMAFKMFVTNYTNISLVGDPNFPVRSSVVLPPGVDLQAENAGNQLVAAFQGEAFDQAAQDSANQNVSSALANSFPSGRRVSDALRSTPRSFALSQEVWDQILSIPNLDESIALGELAARTGYPIRSLVADNADEYTGQADNRLFGYADGEGRPPSTVKGTIRDKFEVEDLFLEAIEFLSCYGAEAGNPDAISRLGLSPNFRPYSPGRTYSETATWNPLGGRRGGRNDPGAPVGQFMNPGFGQLGEDLSAFGRDPLTAVFGTVRTQDRSLQNRARYTEGAGDPLYGYPSDFSGGAPGFGQAGFGDFGGNGFGSGQGAGGDPGFKNPARFTFAGVADAESAFERFLQPQQDPTNLTSGGRGVGLGNAGNTGGASTRVDGRPSAFALVSVRGTLDPLGQARQRPDEIARRQAAQRFGFSVANPFGVNCPAPADDGAFNFTLP